jgi:hypothetical protein
MQRTSFADMTCSIARTLDAAGKWWSPLIVRDAPLGILRLDDLRRDLGISRKVSPNGSGALPSRGSSSGAPTPSTRRGTSTY